MPMAGDGPRRGVPQGADGVPLGLLRDLLQHVDLLEPDTHKERETDRQSARAGGGQGVPLSRAREERERAGHGPEGPRVEGPRPGLLLQLPDRGLAFVDAARQARCRPVLVEDVRLLLRLVLVRVVPPLLQPHGREGAGARYRLGATRRPCSQQQHLPQLQYAVTSIVRSVTVMASDEASRVLRLFSSPAAARWRPPFAALGRSRPCPRRR